MADSARWAELAHLASRAPRNALALRVCACRIVEVLDDLRGHAADQSLRWHVPGDDGSCGDDRARAYADARKDHDPGADPRPVLCLLYTSDAADE